MAKKFQILQPLRNFRIPRHEDEIENYCSGHDETRSNQGTYFIRFVCFKFPTKCDTLAFIFVYLIGS